MNLIKKAFVKALQNTASKYYEGAKLSKNKAACSPIEQFTEWFEIAKEVDPDFADAMTLSTVSASGMPSSRLVLVKEFNEEGFVFYTNYTSRKALEINSNSLGCLVFWWKELYRQVRIEGTICKITDAESDAYFKTRQRGSQIGAWASPQSETLQCRADLETEIKAISKKYEGQNIPRPPFWGGFRLLPSVMEFWQGRSDRLHDRLVYRKTAEEKSWHIDRLSP